MLNRDRCTGCTACSVVCPKEAIHMIDDDYGAKYPVIDERLCIGCNLCEKRCPVLQVERKEHGDADVLAVYAVQTKNAGLREDSSSGGLFSLLARQVLSENGVVIGCAMSEDCYSAHHIFVEDEEGLSLLRGSKYVQSDLKDTISRAVNFVKSGRKVLFSGTPCQVAGLSSALNHREYDNLLLVDFICHGVPVPFAWENYIRSREKAADSKAKRVRFRSKENGWKAYSLAIDFEDDSQYVGKVTEDAYLKGFIQNLYLRSSCYKCVNKGNAYFSDMTIADFWSVGKYLPDYDDNRGTSLAILHTRKAESFLELCKDQARMERVAGVLSGNQSYHYPVPKNPLRIRVLQEMKRRPLVSVLERYYGKSLISRVRRKLYMLIENKE